MTKAQKQEQTEAREKLREILKPGTLVYTIVDHVSRSGMSRRIRCFIVDHSDGGTIRDITWNVSKALSYTMADGSLRVSGCGMDMGFAVVYELSHALYPAGFECIGESPVRCPSNDHSNGDRNYSPDHKHESGGYALRQTWM